MRTAILPEWNIDRGREWVLSGGHSGKVQTSEHKTMKTKLIILGALPLAMILLQGCIAFPPLIQVEHKDGPADAEILKRLDSIDHRLDRLEEKVDKKQ